MNHNHVRLDSPRPYCNKIDALSVFMSNLLANSPTGKVQIVSDNAKKRASLYKIQHQSSRISLRRNQRWSSNRETGKSTSSSPSDSLNDLPLRRKSLERRDSLDSVHSWEFSDDCDDDGISSTVSLDDSYRSCESLGLKVDRPITPAAPSQKYGSPTTTTRKWTFSHCKGLDIFVALASSEKSCLPPSDTLHLKKSLGRTMWHSVYIQDQPILHRQTNHEFCLLRNDHINVKGYTRDHHTTRSNIT